MGFVKAHPKEPRGMGTSPEAFLFLHKALSMRLRTMPLPGKRFHNSMGAALWVLRGPVFVVRLFISGILTTPIFYPIVMAMGYDTLRFGVILPKITLFSPNFLGR
jgi:hypothetical protein